MKRESDNILWMLSKASFSLKITLFYTCTGKGIRRRVQSFQWEEEDGFCGLSLLWTKIEQDMEQLHCCASENVPVTKMPVLEMGLIWPLEIHCPSLSMPTSFRISRNPSCEADTSDAMRVTRSEDENIFRGSLFSSQCFVFVSSCHHILIDLLSCLLITCLCACHKTGESKSPGCALQPKAKAPCASAVEHAELAFVTELVAPHRGDRH